MNCIGMSRSGTVIIELGMVEARALQALVSAMQLPGKAEFNALVAAAPAEVEEVAEQKQEKPVAACRIKKCDVCGSLFTDKTRTNTRRYCSEECVAINQKKLKKASEKKAAKAAKAAKPQEAKPVIDRAARVCAIREADLRVKERMGINDIEDVV